jgi:hypothetical protein
LTITERIIDQNVIDIQLMPTLAKKDEVSPVPVPLML